SLACSTRCSGLTSMKLLVPGDELADAFLDTDLRLEPEHAAGVHQIGIGQPDVSGLVRMALDARFLAQCGADQRDQAIQADSLAAAKIHRLHGPGRGSAGPREGGKDAVQAVGNIGIVALARPIPVHPNGTTPRDQVDELVDRKIEALPWAVDR